MNTVVIALFYNKKLLILQRGSTAPWMPNKWSLVGGIVDKGEDFKTAITREVSEEIGLTPLNIKYINTLGTQADGNIIYFIGQLNSDDVILDYENQNYSFITIDEIEKYNFVPYIVDFIYKCFNVVIRITESQKRKFLREESFEHEIENLKRLIKS